jgi:hypothetical protein
MDIIENQQQYIQYSTVHSIQEDIKQTHEVVYFTDYTTYT